MIIHTGVGRRNRTIKAGELRTQGTEKYNLRGACVDSRNQAQRAAHDFARLEFQPDLTLFVTQSRTDCENVAQSITTNRRGRRIEKRSQ